MFADYFDILSRITKDPLWFDSHGVPRYDLFRPEDMPDVNATEVCLMRIGCPACHHRFLVGMSPIFLIGNAETDRLAKLIELKTVGYGNPPQHRTFNNWRCSGNTMISESIRIIEYWRKVRENWTRDPAFEIVLPDAKTAK
jgi:hypothetical protein